MAKFKKEVDFRVAPAGLALLEGVELSFDDRSNEDDGKGGKKGFLARAKVRVLESPGNPGVDVEGIHVNETFPLWTEFGFERFGGLLLAMFPKQFKADKDYPMGFFNASDVQRKLIKGFGGVHFGSKLRVEEVLKQGAKQGSTNKDDFMHFNRLGTVYDKDEYKDEAKNAKANAKSDTKASDAKGSDDSGSGSDSGGDSKGDDDNWEF